MSDQLPAHFYMAPSSAARWLNCPGSLTYAAQFPDDAGEAADQGTIQHAMVEAELRGEVLTLPPDLEEYRATLSGAQLDYMQDNVDLCVEIIFELPADVLLLEEKIPHAFLAGEHGGTIDVIAVRGGILHVVDFKFGQVPVAIEGNAQIKCYLNLARQRFPDTSVFYGSILQPSVSDQLQTVQFSAAELEAHEVAVVEASISDEFKAGDHCKWCPALIACQVAARHLHAQVQDFPDLSKVDANNLPSEELLADVAKAYKAAKIVEKVVGGAGPLLKSWAALGANVRAHDLSVTNTQRQVWAEGAKDWLLGSGVDPDKLVKESLVTPAQLRKALEISKEQFAYMYPGTVKSVPSQRLNIGKTSKECLEFDEL